MGEGSVRDWQHVSGEILGNTVRIRWENSGLTPAKNIKMKAKSVTIGIDDPIPIISFEENTPTVRIPTLGKDRHCESKSHFTDQEVADCVSKKKEAFILARIWYEDMYERFYRVDSILKVGFALNREHITEIRKNKPAVGQSILITAEYYAEKNHHPA